MNASMETICRAAAIVRRSRKMMKELREWYNHRGTCPDPHIGTFNDWLKVRLDDMAGAIHNPNFVSPAYIAKALAVNAVGDPLALKLADKASKGEFRTDVNCYVEEGVVFSNVLITGEPKATEKKADEIAQKFRDKGYSAEVWIDEEDDTEVSVNAQIDFDVYLKINAK